MLFRFDAMYVYALRRLLVRSLASHHQMHICMLRGGSFCVAPSHSNTYIMRIFTYTPAHSQVSKLKVKKNGNRNRILRLSERTAIYKKILGPTTNASSLVQLTFPHAGMFFPSLKQLQMDNLSKAPLNQLLTHTPVDD